MATVYRNGSITDANNKSVLITSGPLLDRLDSEEFKMLIPSFVLIMFVLVLGIPGNIVTLCVYIKKMRRTASRIFILALTLCDLVNCLLTMPLEIALIINFWTFDQPLFCAIGRTLTYTLNGISALLLVGIAVDRFRKICRPLKPVFTPTKTRYICLSSMAIGVLVYIPGYVMYGTKTILIPTATSGQKVTLVGKTCLIQDKYAEAREMKFVLMVWFILTVLIMVVLIIIYTMIGRAIYKQLKLEQVRRNSLPSVAVSKRAKLRQMVTDQSSETSCSYDGRHALERIPSCERDTLTQSLKNAGKFSKHPTTGSLKQTKMSSRIKAGRTTMMLFFVTIAYILSFLPFCIIVAIRMSSPGLYRGLSVVEKGVWNCFLRSYVLNCAVNPLLYGFFNNDFRTKMIGLFKDCS